MWPSPLPHALASSSTTFVHVWKEAEVGKSARPWSTGMSKKAVRYWSPYFTRPLWAPFQWVFLLLEDGDHHSFLHQRGREGKCVTRNTTHQLLSHLSVFFFFKLNTYWLMPEPKKIPHPTSHHMIQWTPESWKELFCFSPHFQSLCRSLPFAVKSFKFPPTYHLLNEYVSILVQCITSFLCTNDTVNVSLSTNVTMVIFDLLVFLPEDYKLFERRAYSLIDILSTG